MDALAALKHYCPTGTAEGEKNILREIFIHPANFTRLVLPPPGSPRLLVGRKGTGKSLIVDFALKLLGGGGVPCAQLEPEDLKLDNVPSDASVAQVRQHAYEILVLAAANALGERLSGFLTGAEAKLYAQAVNSQKRSADVVSKLAKFLPRIAQSFVNFDLSKLLPSASHTDIAALKLSLNEAIGRDNASILIVVDDTDQIASPDHPHYLNRVWGLILAVRKLAESQPTIRCIVTLRDEIWLRLQHEHPEHRDQIDHFLTLVESVSPDKILMKRIVHRRLELALERAAVKTQGDPYSVFFAGRSPRMPGSEKHSSWEDLIVTRCRERPRDAIQLLNRLADHAIKEPAKNITEKHFQTIIGPFSTSRVDLLSSEVIKECPQIKEIIRSFAGRDIYDSGSFKASTTRVLQHMATIPSRASMRLMDRVLKPADTDDAIALLQYLFQVGFLNARVAKSGPDDYDHLNPVNYPTLVSKATLNDLQSVQWEVHPAYRDFLLMEQKGAFGQRYA